MRISDWSSDVCSSDLLWQAFEDEVGLLEIVDHVARPHNPDRVERQAQDLSVIHRIDGFAVRGDDPRTKDFEGIAFADKAEFNGVPVDARRSEEHTSELQSLMRNSYAVFCLKKKTYKRQVSHDTHRT